MFYWTSLSGLVWWKFWWKFSLWKYSLMNAYKLNEEAGLDVVIIVWCIIWCHPYHSNHTLQEVTVRSHYNLCLDMGNRRQCMNCRYYDNAKGLSLTMGKPPSTTLCSLPPWYLNVSDDRFVPSHSAEICRAFVDNRMNGWKLVTQIDFHCSGGVLVPSYQRWSVTSVTNSSSQLSLEASELTLIQATNLVASLPPQ